MGSFNVGTLTADLQLDVTGLTSGIATANKALSGISANAGAAAATTNAAISRTTEHNVGMLGKLRDNVGEVGHAFHTIRRNVEVFGGEASASIAKVAGHAGAITMALSSGGVLGAVSMLTVGIGWAVEAWDKFKEHAEEATKAAAEAAKKQAEAFDANVEKRMEGMRAPTMDAASKLSAQLQEQTVNVVPSLSSAVMIAAGAKAGASTSTEFLAADRALTAAKDKLRAALELQARFEADLDRVTGQLIDVETDRIASEKKAEYQRRRETGEFFGPRDITWGMHQRDGENAIGRVGRSSLDSNAAWALFGTAVQGFAGGVGAALGQVQTIIAESTARLIASEIAAEHAKQAVNDAAKESATRLLAGLNESRQAERDWMSARKAMFSESIGGMMASWMGGGSNGESPFADTLGRSVDQALSQGFSSADLGAVITSSFGEGLRQLTSGKLFEMIPERLFGFLDAMDKQSNGMVGQAMSAAMSVGPTAVGVAVQGFGAVFPVMSSIAQTGMNAVVDIFKEVASGVGRIFSGTQAGGAIGKASSIAGAGFTAAFAMDQIGPKGAAPLILAGAGALAVSSSFFELATQTKSFQRLQGMLNLTVGLVVTAMEPLWQQLVPLTVVAYEVTAGLVGMVNLFIPGEGAARGLFVAMKQAGYATLEVAREFVWLFNELDKKLNRGRNQIDTGGISTALEDLSKLTFTSSQEFAAAMLAAAGAADGLTRSLTNIPEGYKVESAAYGAQDAAMARGGGGGSADPFGRVEHGMRQVNVYVSGGNPQHVADTVLAVLERRGYERGGDTGLPFSQGSKWSR